MSKDDHVTEGQCDEKLKDVYSRVNRVENNLSRIFGGIMVIAFVSTFVIGFVSFHINQRFSGVEKTLDKMDTRQVEYMSRQAD